MVRHFTLSQATREATTGPLSWVTLGHEVRTGVNVFWPEIANSLSLKRQAYIFQKTKCLLIFLFAPTRHDYNKLYNSKQFVYGDPVLVIQWSSGNNRNKICQEYTVIDLSESIRV